MWSHGKLDEPLRLAFFLQPQFSMMSFTSAVEPLRAANRLKGRDLYHWTIVSKDGRPVTSSSGIDIVPHASMSSDSRFSILFVVAGMNAHDYRNEQVFAWLRRLERQGTALGALSTGSYTLARAGLLRDHRCTLHWENLASFQEAFPDIAVSSEIYEIDRNRLTCSGGTASLDLMLHLIALDHGRSLATEVAEQFMLERIRDERDHQRMTVRDRFGITHAKLVTVIEIMEANLEEPLPRGELAQLSGLSIRQLERLFRKYLGRTPTRFYLELRLDRARRLLHHTSNSVLDVALACGFISASHFSKCYREHYGRSPRTERPLMSR